MRWTLAESATKIVSKLLQKLLGGVSALLIHSLLATLVVGFCQMVGGAVFGKIGRTSFRLDRLTMWAMISGVIVFLGNFSTLAVFFFGGEISVNTFIVTLSIVPGALMDRCFFGHRMEFRKWAGVAVAVLAGYSVLGWPSLQEVIRLPPWVWLSFSAMICVSINQGIQQKIQAIRPAVYNFWVGLTAFSLGIVVALLVWPPQFWPSIRQVSGNFWLIAIVAGLLVVAMAFFSLKSYQGGANIALKKLVMNGAYLTAVMFLGYLIFDERLTVAKLSGIALYLAAFAMMDQKTKQKTPD